MPLLWGVFYTEPQQRWMGSLAAGGPPTMAHLSSPLDHGMSPFGTEQPNLESTGTSAIEGKPALRAKPADRRL